MILKRLIGMFGSLFGLLFPTAMLLATRPPIGGHVGGGSHLISVLVLEAARPGHSWLPPPDVISPRKVDCPGGDDRPRLALLHSPLPDGPPGQRPFAGLTACILVSPAGQVVRVQFLDGAGRRVTRPGIATAILADWRFEATPDWRVLAWQPIPLEGREVMPAISEPA